MTLDSLQEFRVTTSNYSADTGRSSARAGVARHQERHEHLPRLGLLRRTATRVLVERVLPQAAQLAGPASKAPKLDKNICGGSVGGPITQGQAVLLRQLRAAAGESRDAGAPRRAVRLDARRRADLPVRDPSACPGGSGAGLHASRTPCRPGFYGLTPARAGRRSIRCTSGRAGARRTYFKQYPGAERSGPRRLQHRRLPLRVADREHVQHLHRARRLPPDAGSQSLFGRFNFQDDAIVERRSSSRARPPNTTQTGQELGLRASATTGCSRSNKVNTFRYGFTNIVEDTIGLQTESRGQLPVHRRLRRADGDLRPPDADAQLRRRLQLDQGQPHVQVRHQHALHARAALRQHVLVQRRHHQRVVDGRRRHAATRPGNTCPGTEAACAALPAVGVGFQATFADSFAPLLGIVSETDLSANYNVDGILVPVGEPVRREVRLGRVRVLRAGQLEDRQQPDRHRRRALQPVLAAMGDQRAAGGARTSTSATLFDQRAVEHGGGHSRQHAARSSRSTWPGRPTTSRASTTWDKNNFAPALRGGVDAARRRRAFGWLTGGDKLVVRGGYSMVYDRIGQALATQVRPGRLVRPVDAAIVSPFSAQQRRQPGRSGSRRINVHAADAARSAARRLPADAADPAPGIITSALDGIDHDAVLAHLQRRRRPRARRRLLASRRPTSGARGRNQLVRRDLAMPLNLMDPKSGMDYFTAAKQMIDAARSASGTRLRLQHRADPVLGEHVPGCGGRRLDADDTPRRTWRREFIERARLDDGALGRRRVLLSRRAARARRRSRSSRRSTTRSAAQSTIGAVAVQRPAADAAQAVQPRLPVRRQLHARLTPRTTGRCVERRQRSFADFDNGGYTGFLINSWNPDQQYADVRLRRPAPDERELGGGAAVRPRPAFGKDMPRLRQRDHRRLDAWPASVRWTSGFPFNVINCRRAGRRTGTCRATPRWWTPGVLPPTGTTKDVVDGQPSPFTDPDGGARLLPARLPGRSRASATCCAATATSPSTSASSKGWTMPWSRTSKLRFRWDTFNLTNTPRFDVGNVDDVPGPRGHVRHATTARSRPATAAPGAACSSRCDTSSKVAGSMVSWQQVNGGGGPSRAAAFYSCPRAGSCLLPAARCLLHFPSHVRDDHPHRRPCAVAALRGRCIARVRPATGEPSGSGWQPDLLRRCVLRSIARGSMPGFTSSARISSWKPATRSRRPTPDTRIRPSSSTRRNY